MNFSYETQGVNTYLVYEMAANEQTDTMSLGMLSNNKIPGLAQTIFMQMDTQRYIKYNVSSKVSVRQFFSGAVNKKRLLGVFRGIVNAMLSAEEYMLDSSAILTDLDYIFTDVSTCETDLICLPVIDNERTAVDLCSFFKEIMFRTQFDQTENCDHVTKIINYLNSSVMFSLLDFKNLLEQINGPATPQSAVALTTPIRAASVASAPPMPVKQPTVTPSVQPSVPQVQQPVSPQTVVVPNKENSAPAQPNMPQANDKKMSWFYLLQHYNKENAAAYKAQKQAKKNVAKSGVPAQQKVEKKNTKQVVQPTGNVSFAVPGQTAPAVTPARQPAQPMTPAAPQTMPVTPVQSVQPTQPAYTPRPIQQTKPMNFGETTVLGAGAAGETTVLTAAGYSNSVCEPYLIRKSNNEEIKLNKPVFKIGKEKSYVDYFIGDNSAVSRSHAEFLNRDGNCFVMDTNSTNHTYVNGVMIQSNVEIMLKHGDTVRLADEDFEFRLH